jgi:iron complex transport system ATP-binding protein
VADVLTMRGATVVRGGRAILDSVNWSVAPDERWVVLGPNGAGKTTLIQLAGALLHPTAGEVDILGERLGCVDVFELRPRIGTCSSALAEQIPTDERVLDVVLTAAWAVTGRWREPYEEVDRQRAWSVLETLGAKELAERSFGTLSEGERKRVQIARALMTDPEMLLLDEPAAGLDLGAREVLMNRLALVAADRWAPAQVLVTHHVEEIPVGFTHALLLRAGKVLTAGPISEVVTGRWLSAAFGLRLRSGQVRGRHWARAVAEPSESRGRHRGRFAASGEGSSVVLSRTEGPPIDLREVSLAGPPGQ